MGAKITRLSDIGLPSYSVVTAWRKQHERFDDMIRQAEKDRADEYFARAIEQAENLHHQDDVAISRLKHEIYKWGAQTGNTEKYGPKSKVEHEQGPLRVVLDTGIRRNIKDVDESGEKLSESKPKLVGSSED
jgi:hypothetical protein